MNADMVRCVIRAISVVTIHITRHIIFCSRGVGKDVDVAIGVKLRIDGRCGKVTAEEVFTLQRSRIGIIEIVGRNRFISGPIRHRMNYQKVVAIHRNEGTVATICSLARSWSYAVHL